MSRLRKILSAKTSQLQNIPNTKFHKSQYVLTTKCPKLQNIPSYMTEWMPYVLDYETEFVSNSNAIQ